MQLDNLLLQRAADGQLAVKLCDFGYSIDERNTQATAGCGTPEYIAPEVRHSGGFPVCMSCLLEPMTRSCQRAMNAEPPGTESERI